MRLRNEALFGTGSGEGYSISCNKLWKVITKYESDITNYLTANKVTLNKLKINSYRHATVTRISLAINKAEGRTFNPTTCYMYAVVTAMILKCLRQPYTICYGTDFGADGHKTDMVSHVWCRSGRDILDYERAPSEEDYIEKGTVKLQ